MKAITETVFEVRVTGARRGQSKLFDSYPTLGKAKRVGARLAEAGIGAGVIKLTRKIVWHHAGPGKVKAVRRRRNGAETPKA